MFLVNPEFLYSIIFLVLVGIFIYITFTFNKTIYIGTPDDDVFSQLVGGSDYTITLKKENKNKTIYLINPAVDLSYFNNFSIVLPNASKMAVGDYFEIKSTMTSYNQRSFFGIYETQINDVNTYIDSQFLCLINDNSNISEAIQGFNPKNTVLLKVFEIEGLKQYIPFGGTNVEYYDMSNMTNSRKTSIKEKFAFAKAKLSS